MTTYFLASQLPRQPSSLGPHCAAVGQVWAQVGRNAPNEPVSRSRLKQAMMMGIIFLKCF